MASFASSDDEEKLKLPQYLRKRSPPPQSTEPSRWSQLLLVLAAIALWRLSDHLGILSDRSHPPSSSLTRSLSSLDSIALDQWTQTVDRCEDLHLLPGVPDSFYKRTESDRFVPGTTPIVIRNATVWTGEKEGKEILYNHDILLDKGLIVEIAENLRVKGEIKVIEAKSAWVTAGIVDMHAHIGVDSMPSLSGSDDTNSVAAPTLPHLRSLDGINTHDLAFRRTVAGGVTTSLVLPGSANSIGGQAFTIKLRPTKANTPDSLVIEMPWDVRLPSGERKPKGEKPRWRRMKMACGENIKRVHNQVRMDNSWNFRSAFDSARQLKQKQDAFCRKALSIHSKGQALKEEEAEFPDDLKLEALVDVLRGKVLVNTHCYETTDLDQFVRHTNEFEFPIAAFHHAHEAFLVPDLLKQAWPGNGSQTPAVALFATNARYKREAWRGSEYAPKILSENNITIIMKSDHPVLDSRYLLFEAQQAHHFGLPAHLALAAVTTSPARVAGLSHRVGSISVNKDADLVLWSSHPLSLGATPSQVIIDGIPQLTNPQALDLPTEKEFERRNGPEIASVPKGKHPLEEQDDGFDWENKSERGKEWVDAVMFTGVKEVLINRGRGDLVDLAEEKGVEGLVEVVVVGGKIVCVARDCSRGASAQSPSKVVDLKGGSLLPTFFAYGPALGLSDITSEKSTSDAKVFDPLTHGELSRSQQKWGAGVVVRAIDGLSFGGKHLVVADESGVGKAITAPNGNGFYRGVSVAFRTDAKNILDSDAIVSSEVALHIAIGHYKGSQEPSVSTEIQQLRTLLLDGLDETSTTSSKSGSKWPVKNYFSMVAKGELPLVIEVDKADTIASLILLKREIENAAERRYALRWIISGGQEAHLVAKELAESSISVILSPPRSFPESWDARRALPGPPLTHDSHTTVLHRAGVKLALGLPEEWQTRTLLFEAAWAQRLSRGEISRKEAIEWISSNFEEMFGLKRESSNSSARGDKHDFIAYERDPFEFGSRMVAKSKGGGVELRP